MYPISSEGLNKETDEAIYFFTPAFDALNNFSAHTVEIWGKRFPTAEHAYQWRKFYHPPEESERDSAAADVKPRTTDAGSSETCNAIAKQIFEAGSPEKAQRIAHENTPAQPKDWHERKVAVMEEILRAKLAQHEDVREVLQRTGKRKIVENSPVDDFWGCGPSGDGTPPHQLSRRCSSNEEKKPRSSVACDKSCPCAYHTKDNELQRKSWCGGKNMMGELWMKIRDGV